MTPDELAEKEAMAERFVRRGELLKALTLFRQVAAAQPGRADLTQRMRELAESMDPAELRAASGPAQVPAKAPTATPEEEGERLFQLGDYAGAAAAYRKALEAKPSSTLIRERLVELFQLAQAQNGRPATARPAQPPTGAPQAAGQARATPVDPEALLRSFLDRISERRRR
jgi:tetratricopeptide (TPR) repeat protein